MVKWYEMPVGEGSNVIYSRVRLVRNWSEYPFPGKLTDAQSAELTGRLTDGLRGLGSLDGTNYQFSCLDRMPELE